MSNQISNQEVCSLMDGLREQFGFEDLSDEWCENLLKDDFCSYNWPDCWTFQESTVGLEAPFENLFSYLNSKGDKIWDVLIISDVTRLQCITNIVLESCIKSHGSPYTALMCGACYVKLSSTKGASARNTFHGMIFSKIMEILKTQEDPDVFGALCKIYESLTGLINSDFSLMERTYWQLVKSSLSSVNLNCSHKKSNSQSFEELLSALLKRAQWFKIFAKESMSYICAGNSYIGSRCSQLICDFVSSHLEDNSIINHHMNFVQHLCGSISSRTETRKQVEIHILEMIRVLPDQAFLDLMNWLVSDHCMSSKIVHRLFGVELCFQLSFHVTERMPESHDASEVLFQAITYHISDKAPTVRAKSATVLCDLIKCNEKHIVDHFGPHFDPNHPNNILKNVDRLSNDSAPAVRRSICQLLFAAVLKYGLRTSWLKHLYQFTLDTAVSVKKQGLISICQLLNEHDQNSKIRRLWLETILYRLSDNENTIRDFCSEQLQLLIGNLADSQTSWEIIKLIADPRSLDLQKLFENGIQLLSDYRISEANKNFIMGRLDDPENYQTVLFIVSKFINQFDFVDGKKLLEIFDHSVTKRSDQSYQTMCIILSCLRKIADLSETDSIIQKLISEVHKFNHPYILVKELIMTISNLVHRTSKDLSCYEETMSTINNVLQNLCLSKNESSVMSSKKLCCYLFTLGEVSSQHTNDIDNDTILCLKELIINTEETISTAAQAHAIMCFGKICLAHEVIAKDSILLLCNVLDDNKNFQIRNNIMIVLGDLIVRYPTIIGSDYLYFVTDRLQDGSVMIRRQAISIITKLLQEDYIKWRSGTVMKFITNLVDENAEIRQLCELCMTNVVLLRYPETFTEFFIEVTFFLHGLENFLSVPDPNLLKFSLPGNDNETKRRSILQVMMKNFTDQQKLCVTARICKEILSLFTNDDDQPIDAELVPLLKDSLWILSCDSLKLSSLKSKTCHDFDEDDSKLDLIAAQTKVMSSIVVRNFVENCTPIILQLNNKLKKLKSPLQLDFNRFIVLFMKDFKNEIDILSGGNAQFVAEIKHDIECMEKQSDDIDRYLTKQGSSHTIVSTPGFLRALKTPQSSIALSLSKGPSGLFQTPFFTAPTPYTVSKSLALKKEYKGTNVAQQQLRKNLLANFAASSSRPLPDNDISVSEMLHDPAGDVQCSNVSHDAAQNSIEMSKPSLQDGTINVTGSAPVDGKINVIDENKMKTKKTLFNPEDQRASIGLRKSVRLSSGRSIERSRSAVPHKPGKEHVLHKDYFKKILVTNEPQVDVDKLSGGPEKAEPQAISLGQLIKARLKDKKKAEKTVAKKNRKSDIKEEDAAANSQNDLPSSSTEEVISGNIRATEQNDELEIKSGAQHLEHQSRSVETTSSELGNVSSCIPSVQYEDNAVAGRRLSLRRKKVMKLFQQFKSPDEGQEAKGNFPDKETTKQPVDGEDEPHHENPSEVIVQTDTNVLSSEGQKISSKRRSARLDKLVKQYQVVSTSDMKMQSQELPSGKKNKVDAPCTLNQDKPTFEVAADVETNKVSSIQKIVQQIQKANTDQKSPPKEVSAPITTENDILAARPPSSNEEESIKAREKGCEINDHELGVNAKVSSASRKMNKFVEKLKPVVPSGPSERACIIEGADKILLANQVLRKRKIPNASGYEVLQEDDFVPKPKRRSFENIIHSRDSKPFGVSRRLSQRLEEKYEKTLPATSEALAIVTPVAEKMRRSSERLMKKQDVTFNLNDPGIVSSTPFVFGKTSKSSRMVSSTPFFGKIENRLDCDLSPIQSSKKR